jgi:hypothetical protein
MKYAELILTLLCAIAAVIIFRFVTKEKLKEEHQDYSQLRQEFLKKHKAPKHIKI